MICGEIGNNVDRNKFVVISSLNGYCFQKIACGVGFAIAFTDNFDYFGWGLNDYGQLGLGHNNYQCGSPQQIHLNLQVSFFCLFITHYRLIDEQLEC
ncbi:hypothetical protein LCGC14_1897150 [marine sediment metagenome]|uniref:Uncharacterized protein n=1 Tax=marine sediment metagenome TaxID=412755 RepID=A0A0F9FXX2_9ZZZZ